MIFNLFTIKDNTISVSVVAGVLNCKIKFVNLWGKPLSLPIF